MKVRVVYGKVVMIEGTVVSTIILLDKFNNKNTTLLKPIFGSLYF